MLSVDELREELAILLKRIKPQAEWTGFQDYIDQRAIAKRVHLIRTCLDNDQRTQNPEQREEKAK